MSSNSYLTMSGAPHLVGGYSEMLIASAIRTKQLHFMFC